MKRIFYCLFLCCFSGLFGQSFIEGENKIEYFLSKPDGVGPFPLIIMLHGSQPLDNSSGGKQMIDLDFVSPFVKEGIAVVSVSAPGFGQSEGKRDWAGPASQEAVLEVMKYCKTLPFIDEERIGLYGVSKGAILASMVSTVTSDITFQILEAGSYDLPSRFHLLPEYLHGILDTMQREAGMSEEALMMRSAVHHVDKITAKTLILHGEFDDRRGLPSAIALHEGLQQRGVESQLVIFPNTLHVIGFERWQEIIPFVRGHFFDLYGIGMKIDQVPPALQVVKIYQGSPAELSGKLKVGDVILGISPQNDATEINVLMMPIREFVTYTLGKKGEHLRLRVQHFDYTIEEIVIERGERQR